MDYSLTITLRPKCYTQEPEKQYDNTYEYVSRKIRSLTQTYTLIAEVTKAYNVHYHSILRISPNQYKDNLKQIYACFRNDNLIGYIKCDQTINYNKWVEYLQKDIIHTMNALNRRPIIYDQYDIFDESQRASYGINW